MGLSVFRLVLAGLAAGLLVPPPAQAIEPGQVAPEFELPGRQGVVRLADVYGDGKPPPRPLV